MIPNINPNPHQNNHTIKNSFTAEEFCLHLPKINTALEFFNFNYKNDAKIKDILDKNSDDIQALIANMSTSIRSFKKISKKSLQPR